MICWKETIGFYVTTDGFLGANLTRKPLVFPMDFVPGFPVKSPLDQSSDYAEVSPSGWWFGTWLLFFHILGSSNSQLTKSIIFQGGRAQPPTSHDML